MRTRYPDKRVIGLTGGMGTGKTTVARMFAASGAEVIDADRIAHGMLRKGGAAYTEIVRSFGKSVLSADGTIDRRALGRKAFRSGRAKGTLESILHPRILRRIDEKVRQSRKKLVVIDAPLLYETGMEHRVDKVLVVTASRRTQISRCAARTGLSRGEILSRIAAQLPLKRKVRSADFIIDNDGTLQETKAQMESIRRSVWKS